MILLPQGPKGLPLYLRVALGFSSGQLMVKCTKISIAEEHPGVPVEDPPWLVGFKMSLGQGVLVLRAVVCTDRLSLVLGAKAQLHVFALNSPAGLLIWS